MAKPFNLGIVYGETFPNGFWIKIWLLNWGLSIVKNGKYRIQILFK